jgi:hypothetical protein
MAVDQGLSSSDLYAMVREGTWTFDAFEEIISQFTNDSDGDGAFTVNDTYGFASNMGYHAITWGYAAGNVSVKLDPASDTPVQLGWDNERFYDTCLWLYDILYSGNLTYEIEWNKECDIYWDENRVFIEAIWLADLERFRDCESDYGVLPYAKFDEAQDKYYCYADGWCVNVLSVPTTNTDPDSAGFLFEAMAADSLNNLTPAYFDVVLTDKYARDAQSVRMLDLILDSVVMDNANIFSWGSIESTVSDAIYKGGAIASAVEKRLKALDKAMAKTVEAFLALEQ